jgi:choline kinase
MNFDVIITCSGLGSRLRPMTNYLNKALVKLGDKAIISHILESYPKNCRFIVTIGYLGDQVMDYIEINHSDLNIEYVSVNPYDGEGSSLLYSLSRVFPLLDKPFVYNACDTYVAGNKNLIANTAIVAKAYIGNQYRKYTTNIENDPANVGELCYTGLCYIKDYEKFKEIAYELLKSTKYDNNLSDAHVIEKMNMNFFETDNWIDIGNFIALEQAKKQFESKICVLEKNDQETYLVGNKILKFFKDEHKVEQLYLRSLELKKCVPVCKKKGNFIFYHWVEGETLSKILNKELLDTFLDWCKDNLWSRNYTYLNENFFKDFYINKAKARVESYIKHHPQDYSVNYESPQTHIKINFIETKGIITLLDKIPEHFHNKCRHYHAHGDLVFENVIKTDNGFTLIDWREGFAPCKGSDMLYDIAKMKHNLYFDHDVIKNKNFFVKKMPNNTYLFDSGTPWKNIDLIKQLDQWCINNSIEVETINLIVSLIQLSSSALHLGDEALLLFYMGWYGLSKVLQKN